MQPIRPALGHRVALAVAAFTCTACSTLGGVRDVPPVASSAARAPHLAREHVIYNFQGGSGGAGPEGTLIADRSGALYGTTAYGGIYGCTFNAGCGTVFKLTPSAHSYSHSVLYEFLGGTDGDGPGSGVVADKSGALYGTTEYGGPAGDGSVFKLTRSGSSYTETVLHSFAGGDDGNAPLAGLTIDASGNLYGATLLGGGGSQCTTGAGCGVIFELRRSGSTYSERVLHTFTGGSDGATPGSPPIFVGRDLYGTAATGGGNPSCGGAPINPGCGTVFELVRRGRAFTFKVLYRFAGAPSDAANAFAGLAIGTGGALYGAGQYGGSQNEGAVFALSRTGRKYSETLLHSFTGGHDGSYPLAALAVGGDGALYGTTQYGGTANAGTVFEVTSSGSERVLFAFPNGTGGGYPLGGVLVGSRGGLWGTAEYGGKSSLAAGIAFKLTPW
jgi:uncharacterized repeat protein (TIGR03803 family)